MKNPLLLRSVAWLGFTEEFAFLILLLWMLFCWWWDRTPTSHSLNDLLQKEKGRGKEGIEKVGEKGRWKKEKMF